MKNGYAMNFATNTVTITKDFEKKAAQVNSIEYQIMKQLRSDFPNLHVALKAAPKRKTSIARPTYDKMVKFLSAQTNAAILLNEFAEVRERSKAQENPYLYVREWFVTSFANYQEVPKFDEKGNILTQYGASVKNNVISMEEQKQIA